MNKTTLLIIGAILVAIGLFKPSITDVFRPQPTPIVVIDDKDLPKPSDVLLERANDVVKAFSVNSDRKIDAKRLANLYKDIADLVALDGDNEIIKTTDEIRQANKLAGIFLQLNIKDKYPDLSEAAQGLMVAAIGDDSVSLNAELRQKTVEGFRALAWACNEGSK